MNDELQTGNGAHRWLQRRFGCTGLKIPLRGPWQVEVWLCPRGAEIPEHRHPNIDSRLVFLGGGMKWSLMWPVEGELGSVGFTKILTWRHLFRSYRVAANCVHGATTTGRFGLFLNLERWTGPKTSAAHDLELA